MAVEISDAERDSIDKEYLQYLYSVHKELELKCKELSQFNTLDAFFEELQSMQRIVSLANFNQGKH